MGRWRWGPGLAVLAGHTALAIALGTWGGPAAHPGPSAALVPAVLMLHWPRTSTTAHPFRPAWPATVAAPRLAPRSQPSGPAPEHAQHALPAPPAPPSPAMAAAPVANGETAAPAHPTPGLAAAPQPATGPTAPPAAPWATVLVAAQTTPAGHSHCPPAKHPAALQERGIEGLVRLRVQVLAQGQAGQVLLQASSGWRLMDEAALASARACRFQPAKDGERSIESWVEFPVRFALR